jgi:hypothetical protein
MTVHAALVFGAAQFVLGAILGYGLQPVRKLPALVPAVELEKQEPQKGEK